MYQNLIHGINKAKLNASYKNAPYRTRFGFIHEGIDLVATNGRTEIYGNGNGKVLKSGYDSIFGNFAAILYKDCYNRKTKEIADLVLREWHMAKVYVVANQTITKDTMVGLYGSTGSHSTGPHLHMEVSTDTTNYMWTPTLSGNSSHFIGKNPNAQGVPTKASDKYMSNPLEWLNIKIDEDDLQTWTTNNDEYINSEDKTAGIVTALTMFVKDPIAAPPVVVPATVVIPKDLTLESLYKMYLSLEERIGKVG